MELLGPILSIILIDIVLSGDNAILIGLAAHGLPPTQRRLAIILGGAGAVGLRILNTSIATLLLQVPALKLIGGFLLVWISFKLLRQEETQHGSTKAASTFRAAMGTILLADFIMSLDNVLAVAATAHGSVELLIFGLLLSMPIVLFCGSLVSKLVDRLWWLAYVGAAVIAWTGAAIMLEDDIIHGAIAAPAFVGWLLPAVAVVGTVGFSHWFHRRPSRASKPVLAGNLAAQDDAGE